MKAVEDINLIIWKEKNLFNVTQLETKNLKKLLKMVADYKRKKNP